MNIGIFGASGFIGANLLKLFQKNGHSCVGISRVSNVEQINSVNTQIDFSNVDVLARNLSDLHISHVINAIGMAHDKRKIDDKIKKAYHKVNVEIAAKIADASKLANVQQLIHLSSSKVYGNLVQKRAPSEENYCKQLDIYGATKLNGEKAVCEVLENSKTSNLIVRMPLVYGPGVKGNLKTLTHLLSGWFPLPLNGIVSNQRSLLSIYNLHAFLENCLFGRSGVNGIFNIKDHQDYSTAEIVRRINRANNFSNRNFNINEVALDKFLGVIAPSYQERLTRDNVICDLKARKQLGWIPHTSKDEDFLFTTGDE